MIVVLSWLSKQVIWIALICFIGAVGYLITALNARRLRNVAQFSLERDAYQQRFTRSLTVAFLFLLLAGAVYLLSEVVTEQMDTESIEPTPTPQTGLFTLTPESVIIGTPSNISAGDTITQVVVEAPGPQSTLTPLPTAVDTSPDLWQPDCPNPDVQLTFPLAGGEISGNVDIQGIATGNAFSYYRFEVMFPGSDIPNFIGQYENAVENGQLGTWDINDPSRYPPGGPYRFILVVADIYGNTSTCVIPVQIIAVEE